MARIPHIAFLIAACLTLMLDSTAQTVVFDTDVTAGRYYRIPALVQLLDGRLLAIGDDRHGSDHDIGGNHGIEGLDKVLRTKHDVDIVGRFGDDKGQTWGEPFMIADGDGRREGFHDSHGDGAAVVDRETGQVLIMCASGDQGFLNATLQEPLRVGRYISDDDGKTWTGDDVTSDIYGIFDGCPEVNALFFSSGRICQSSRIKQGSHYRIYSAIDGPMGVGCLVLYSDDFGISWRALGGTSFNIYDYATGSWGEMAVSNDPESGTYSEDCSCNGELLIVPARRTSDDRSVHLALQSVPRGKGRQRVSIYYKVLLDGRDYDEPSDFSWGWQHYQVTEGYSAYSTMIAVTNGDIAFLHEDCNDNQSTSAYDLLFRLLSIHTITGGRYTAIKP